MTDLSWRGGSPELARVAEWTVHCFQHKLLATWWLSESYDCFRWRNHPGGSLQGKDHPPFCIMVSSCELLLSIQTNWDNVCGEQDDPNSVHCLVALLKQPQIRMKMSSYVFYVHLLISVREQSSKAAACELLGGGNDPATSSSSLILHPIIYTSVLQQFIFTAIAASLSLNLFA